MRRMKLRKSILIATLLLAPLSALASVSSELEGLGSNREIRERAFSLENRTRIGIVQGRAVDRNLRFELGGSFGPSVFGDPYVATQNLAARADFHINPRWSLGVQYTRNLNALTAEGKRRFDQARADQQTTGTYSIPQVTYPQESVLGFINWYMLYGKMNLFDLRVVQFDLYAVAGFGQINLATDIRDTTLTEWTNLWTGGMGIGFWLSQNFSSRVEIRYQGYEDNVYTGTRNINQAVATIGLGVLL